MEIEQLAGYCVHCLREGKRKQAFTVYNGNSTCYDHFALAIINDEKNIKRP